MSHLGRIRTIASALGAPSTGHGRPVCNRCLKKSKKFSRHSGNAQAKAQRNFTVPDSRIVPGRNGFVQAYNGRAVVDSTAQVIVAHSQSNSSADAPCLISLTDAVTRNMGKAAQEISADAGYCSEANLAALKERKIAA